MSLCFACGHDMLDSIRPTRVNQVVGCNQRLNISRIEWQDDTMSIEPIVVFPPIAESVSPDTIMAEVLDNVPDAITHLPVLNEIPQEVVSMIHITTIPISDVVSVIKKDPALSTSILSMANSAFYATVTEITTFPLHVAGWAHARFPISPIPCPVPINTNQKTPQHANSWSPSGNMPSSRPTVPRRLPSNLVWK